MRGLEPLLAQAVMIQPRESCQVPQPPLPVPRARPWVWSTPAPVLTQSSALGWAADPCTDVSVIADILRLPRVCLLSTGAGQCS